MGITLSTPDETHWPVILGLANAAVPWDVQGNQQWLANRQAFSGRRRHYIARDGDSGAISGYGAIEEGPESDTFRIYVVSDAERLAGDVGQAIYARLIEDLAAFGARRVWAREYASDDAILAFFTANGLVEQDRFTPPGYQEMVVLMSDLAQASK